VRGERFSTCATAGRIPAAIIRIKRKYRVFILRNSL
jgi:hypothetical protein